MWLLGLDEINHEQHKTGYNQCWLFFFKMVKLGVVRENSLESQNVKSDSNASKKAPWESYWPK